MSSQGLITLMSFAEFGLWAALCLMFWAQNLDRRFPAMGAYLVLRLVSMPVLLVLFYGQSQHWFSGRAYLCYFCVYWAVYIASAVMIFFICQEVFRSALSAFTGLQRLGIVVFRWAALASTFASFSTLSFAHLQISMVPLIAYRLMRSISILEICLLGFLCLSMNALRLSTRSMTFGIARTWSNVVERFHPCFVCLPKLYLDIASAVPVRVFDPGFAGQLVRLRGAA